MSHHLVRDYRSINAYARDARMKSDAKRALELRLQAMDRTVQEMQAKDRWPAPTERLLSIFRAGLPSANATNLSEHEALQYECGYIQGFVGGLSFEQLCNLRKAI